VCVCVCVCVCYGDKSYVHIFLLIYIVCD